MMNGIDIRAILLATLAVFGDQAANGSEEQVRAAVEALSRNPAYLRTALVLGTASTVVGGFLVARIARRIPYFNALAYGVLGAVLSTLTTGDLPMWFRVVGIGLTVPAALLGAYFAKRQATRP